MRKRKTNCLGGGRGQEGGIKRVSSGGRKNGGGKVPKNPCEEKESLGSREGVVNTKGP